MNPMGLKCVFWTFTTIAYHVVSTLCYIKQPKNPNGGNSRSEFLISDSKKLKFDFADFVGFLLTSPVKSMIRANKHPAKSNINSK